jgi:mannose-6-phosphate isomerase
MNPALSHPLHKPLLLSPENLTDHMWGGSWIRAFKGLAASPHPVGESWELSARAERASGVEVEPGRVVPLPDLLRDHASHLLGAKMTRVHGERLPLLTKFIDAEDDLSVQVHPHDAHLSYRESGKSESWLILDVAPGEGSGFIYLGFDPAKFDSYATPDEFAEAFFAALNQANSMGPSEEPAVRAKAERVVLPFLNRVRVTPGDVFEVKPGMIHAIGRGVRLFEIQQASDITYRVWDWNRPDAKEKSQGRLVFRALHVAQARAVLDFAPRSNGADNVAPKTAGEHELVREREGRFLLAQINLTAASPRFPLKTNGVFQALTVIDGRVEIGGVRAERGRSVLIPADLAEASLVTLSPSASVLRSTVPL